MNFFPNNNILYASMISRLYMLWQHTKRLFVLSCVSFLILVSASLGIFRFSSTVVSIVQLLPFVHIRVFDSIAISSFLSLFLPFFSPFLHFILCIYCRSIFLVSFLFLVSVVCRTLFPLFCFAQVRKGILMSVEFMMFCVIRLYPKQKLVSFFFASAFL